MPLTTGRYMDSQITSRRARAAHRWRWVRTRVSAFVMYPPWWRHPEDTGAGHDIYREWGLWVLRPASGWRSWRWITPPTAATHTIPHDDRDTALEWAMKVLGI
jgi:hypothetical protein